MQKKLKKFGFLLNIDVLDLRDIQGEYRLQRFFQVYLEEKDLPRAIKEITRYKGISGYGGLQKSKFFIEEDQTQFLLPSISDLQDRIIKDVINPNWLQRRSVYSFRISIQQIQFPK